MLRDGSTGSRKGDPAVAKRSLAGNLVHYRYFYLMLVPAIVLLFVFNYMPIYGIVISFQNFKLLKGVWGSEWVGLTNLLSLFNKPSFLTALSNTVVISLLRLAFSFPAPILFALLINEMRPGRFKKYVQTVSYLPYFVSWVIVSGMVIQVLSQRGLVNALIDLFGGQKINFIGDPFWFMVVLIVSGIWQGVGWGSVIYLSALAGISRELYESAHIDGASRLQQARYISLPGMYPMIIISLMLTISNILNAGFDQVFNLYNPSVYRVADIIDTYMYRLAFRDVGGTNYSLATAVGLFKNVVGFTLLYFSNRIVRRFSDYSFW